MALTTVTDAAPLIELTVDKILQDENRMKKLIATFCDGIFSYAEEDIASRIVDDGLKICCGSKQTLSKILQTKFFANHTPFYWAIVNRHSQPGMPPLLKKLFQICPYVDHETQEDIIQALLEGSEDELYQNIEEHLAGFRQLPVTTIDCHNEVERMPTVLATTITATHGTFDFKIPFFFDRLLLDKEVCIAFVAMGSFWELRAYVADPSLAKWWWRLALNEKRTKHAYDKNTRYKRLASIKLKQETGTGTDATSPSSATLIIDRTPTTLYITIAHDDLRLFRCNPYTSNPKRELAFILEIKDTKV